MNYQPYFNLHLLISNEGVAVLFCIAFSLFVVLSVLLLTSYQAARSARVGGGKC